MCSLPLWQYPLLCASRRPSEGSGLPPSSLPLPLCCISIVYSPLWPCRVTVAEFCSSKNSLHETWSWKPCLYQGMFLLPVLHESSFIWFVNYSHFLFHFRATQYTCMLLSYLLEPQAGKEKVVMKLKKLESSVSTGRKCK